MLVAKESGISFEDDYEFPWDNEEYEGCTDSWWRNVNGYKPTMEIWDKDGEYIEGVTKEQESEYYREKRKWDHDNPQPFELMNYCSHDYPMYILALPSTCKTANRGDIVDLKPKELKVSPFDKEYIDFMKFIKKFDLKGDVDIPYWCLFSSMG